MSEDFNHDYLAERALALGGRILDYGCGYANVVRRLRAVGADAYGADVFFDGMDWTDGPADLLESGIVRQITAGRLPFADASFHTIVSDQVIEHVEDLPAAIAEMARVLAPGGRMYHQYPVLEVVREPHTAIAWSHRVRSPQPRTTYLRAARSLGLGKHKGSHASAAAWSLHFSHWLDAYCHYRPRRVIEQLLHEAGFTVVHRELDYCLARAGRRAIAAPIRRLPNAAAAAFRLLAFDCIEASREPEQISSIP